MEKIKKLSASKSYVLLFVLAVVGIIVIWWMWVGLGFSPVTLPINAVVTYVILTMLIKDTFRVLKK